jgi:mono/diheme cytochrome c family protein
MKIPAPSLLRKTIPASAWICLAIMAVACLGCAPETAPSFEQGKGIYQNDCLACHGREGGGVLYRKTVLNGSAFVTGNPDQVLATILFGKDEGEGTMPSWQMKLTDQEVAAVATYIRQAWSNRADLVTPEMVAQVRARKAKSPSTGP